MLHISRKAGEGVVIDGRVRVQVLEVRGKTVKIGVSSPPSLPVLREEIFEQISQENRAASQSNIDLLQQFVKARKITE